jgi:hypothetical protein
VAEVVECLESKCEALSAHTNTRYVYYLYIYVCV